MVESRGQSGGGQRKNFTGCCSCRVSPKVETTRVSDSDRKKDRDRDRRRRGKGGREGRKEGREENTHKDRQTDRQTHTLIEKENKDRHKTRERGFGRNREKYIHMRDRQRRKDSKMDKPDQKPN